MRNCLAPVSLHIAEFRRGYDIADMRLVQSTCGGNIRTQPHHMSGSRVLSVSWIAELTVCYRDLELLISWSPRSTMAPRTVSNGCPKDVLACVSHRWMEIASWGRSPRELKIVGLYISALEFFLRSSYHAVGRALPHA